MPRSRPRLPAAAHRHEHRDLVADARVERVSETRAEHDVPLARLQIVQRPAFMCAPIVGDLRLDLRLDAANHGGAQILAAAEHALQIEVRRDLRRPGSRPMRSASTSQSRMRSGARRAWRAMRLSSRPALRVPGRS